jgi:hypothetical protein
MSDMDDMMAKLQMGLAQQTNQGPSLFGLQAQQDPNVTAALLKHLQDQAYVQQQGDDNSQYGFLTNQSKKDFARMGQGIGNLLGIGAPPTYDNASVLQQRQAITDGKGQLQQYLTSGMDPNQAQIKILTALSNAGIPNAADALERAQTTMLKNAQTQASTQESLGKVDNYKSEDAHRQFEEQQAAFTPRPDLSNSEYIAQQQGGPNGRIIFEKRGDKMPPAPLSPGQDAAIDNAVDMVGTNKIGIADALSRTAGPQRFDFLSRLGAKYPDYNTPAFKAKTALVQAYTSGSQGQAAIKMENAANHSDMVDQAGQALENGDLPKLNKIANALGVQTGGMTTPVAVYNAILPIYAAEVNSSLVKGGGGEAEREARIAALGSDLPQASRHAALMGIQGMLRAQAGNMEHIYRTKTQNTDFYDMYPGLKQAPNPPQQDSATPQASPQAANRPPVQVKSRADAMALPAGTVFVTPDGRQLVR